MAKKTTTIELDGKEVEKIEDKPVSKTKTKSALQVKLSGIKKKYGEWSAGIMADSNWPDVTEWIPTGSTWLDSIIKEGVGCAGYPVGRVSSLQGLSGCLTEDMVVEVIIMKKE